MAGKKLVAYFSATGTTESLARALATAAGADLVEILPVAPYSSADLDWTDRGSRSTLEMKDASVRPAISTHVDNMADYDTIFLGFPIWWGEAPRVCQTFLEDYDLAGKTVVPFATSGGSAIGGAHRALVASAKGAKVERGELLNGRQNQDKLAKWAARF